LVSNSESIKTTIFENIKSYANSIELNQYGARFKYSKFQSIIDNSHESITSNITKIKIRRDLKASLNQIADYEICFGNEFHIQNVNGYNIKSSGFKISGVSDVLYLSDIPDSNQVTGTIFFFKLLSDTQPLIVRQSAGTINYKKGEIILNPVNIISTSKTVQEQPIIEISAISKSNDIIGLQDLYLQLDINKSVVNMLSDEISSGSDPSGTLYVTTSSYNNGNLVRV
jgi:hypothetical protein